MEFYISLLGASSPEVTKQGNDLVFRLWASEAYDVTEVVKYAISTLGLKSMSGIYMSDNPLGIALRDILKNKVVSLGGEVLSGEMIDSKNTDVKTSVQKMISGNPDAVYICLNPDQSVLVVNQLKAMGYKGKIFVYGASALTEGYASKIKNKDNVFYANPVTIQETSFWADYKAKTGTDADILAGLGYDSMKMIEDGINQCGENNACISKYFLNIKDYQTSRGKIYFDQYGDVNGFKYEIKAL